MEDVTPVSACAKLVRVKREGGRTSSVSPPVGENEFFPVGRHQVDEKFKAMGAQSCRARQRTFDTTAPSIRHGLIVQCIGEIECDRKYSSYDYVSRAKRESHGHI